jgi:hypothetical protein
MKLLTKELEKEFPPLYANENKKPEEIKIIAKFFDPTGSWTWYATEFDPETRNFFGFVRGFENELGYFNLNELQSVKGRFGLGIERDLYFGDHTLAEVMEKGL